MNQSDQGPKPRHPQGPQGRTLHSQSADNSQISPHRLFAEIRYPCRLLPRPLAQTLATRERGRGLV